MLAKVRQHVRLKPKPGTPPTAAERRHMDRIVAMGCVVCAAPATVHHVTAGIHGGRIARSHQRTAPLCPTHHQVIYGPMESVEALGHGGFFRMYGIDLLEWSKREWENSCGVEEQF